MKRKSPIKRGGKPNSRNKARQARTFPLDFHSPERVAFVQTLPCVTTGCLCHPSQNAHTRSGGAGRRGPYRSIVPACARCHSHAHQRGWASLLGPDHESILVAEAARVERRWLAFSLAPETTE